MTDRYSITVTAAELEVVALALGRMLKPRKVATPKSAGPTVYRHRVPRLSDKAYANLTGRWRDAIANPKQWHAKLQMEAARNTNRSGHDICKAWGITDRSSSATS